MNVKVKFFRNLLFILFMTASFLLLSPTNSAAYFDKLSKDNINSITIGEWDFYGQPKDIVEIIKEEQGWVSGNDFYDDYLFDLIFVKKDPDNEEHDDLDPLYKDYVEVKDFYQNYTIPEIIEVIELLKDFSDSFLIEDGNNNPVYPNGLTVEPVELELGEGLLPGQSKQIHQVLHTADATSENNNAWIPIMIALSIEAPADHPEGYDVSDFAIELLIDGNPFSVQNPMTYRYVLWDKYSGGSKNRLQSSQVNISSFNNTVNETIYYNNEILRKDGNNYNSVLYKHKLTKPTLFGNWNRFIYGPNYYLGLPTGGNYHQTYYAQSNSTREGMILNGTADGKVGEIRLEIPNRNPQDTYAIPIVINISRGLELGTNQLPIESQKEDEILPVVKIKIVRGEFLWAN